MQRRKGLIFPRIVEEVVNIDELRKVWNCGYMTVNRIMHGHKAPNHQQKEQLSEYLGIPVEELFVRSDAAKAGELPTLEMSNEDKLNSKTLSSLDQSRS